LKKIFYENLNLPANKNKSNERNDTKNHYYENMKLALKWNRIDLVKMKLFGKVDLEMNQLSDLMEMALVENKPEFVKLILDSGLDLKSFLNTRRLYFLYNLHNVVEKLEKKSPLHRFYRNRMPNPSDTHHNHLITFKDIEKVFKLTFFDGFQPHFLPQDDFTNVLREFIVIFHLFFIDVYF